MIESRLPERRYLLFINWLLQSSKLMCSSRFKTEVLPVRKIGLADAIDRYLYQNGQYWYDQSYPEFIMQVNEMRRAEDRGPATASPDLSAKPLDSMAVSYRDSEMISPRCSEECEEYRENLRAFLSS